MPASRTTAADTAPPAAAAVSTPAEPPLDTLLASADPARGQAYTKKICIACHNFAEGAGNKVGPDLYGVVGRDKGSYPGYTYSAAMKAKGGKWTFADLNTWLTKPSAFIHGTKMAYAGQENPQLRADVIDYLRTLSHNPEPLPGGATQAATAPSPASPVASAPAPAKPAVVAPAPVTNTPKP
jgi:cytochrome c